ncbi:hypothetical protein OFC04_12235, partial [Escherichia coli]|nr:hypothetical protein [Escherichia coli]
KSAQIREILISESAWEEMTCLFAPSLAGTSDKLDAFLASIRDVAKIVEVARSGVVGLSRGDKIMR